MIAVIEPLGGKYIRLQQEIATPSGEQVVPRALKLEICIRNDWFCCRIVVVIRLFAFFSFFLSNLLFAQLLSKALLVFTNCNIQKNVSVMGSNFNNITLSELINKPRSCSVSGHTSQLLKLLHEHELYMDRVWCNLKKLRRSNPKHLSCLEPSEQSSCHPHPRQSASLLYGNEH